MNWVQVDARQTYAIIKDIKKLFIREVKNAEQGKS
jgi:hypothetical protein